MDLRTCALVAGLLAAEVLPAQQALPAAWARIGAGVAPVWASSPYAGSLTALAGLAVAARIGDRSYLDVEGIALGAVTPADAYVTGARSLPNTVGAAVRMNQLVGRKGNWSVGAGVGGYRIARRAQAAGGTGVGYEVGVNRIGPGFVTYGARVVLVPSIAGSRMWMLPVTMGLRTR